MEGRPEAGAGITFPGNAGFGQSQEQQNQQSHLQERIQAAHGKARVGVDVLFLGQTGLCLFSQIPRAKPAAHTGPVADLEDQQAPRPVPTPPAADTELLLPAGSCLLILKCHFRIISG